MGVKITQMSELLDPADDDVFVIDDIDVPQSKKITVRSLRGGKVTNVTEDYTITRAHEIVFVTGTVTITFLAAVRADFAEVINMGSGVVTIIPFAGDTIEGSSQYKLTGRYQSAGFFSDQVDTWVEM